MIVTYIYSNCPQDQIKVQLRCRNFVDAINRTGSHSANLLDIDSFIENSAEAQKLCAGSDIIVIYRYLFGPILKIIQYWKARDKKVIVDFDQAINYLTPEHPGHSFWMQGVPPENCFIGNKFLENPIDPIPLEQFKWGLGMVDAATVSSARLADDWAQLTTIYEIPNYLNTYQYPALNQAKENEVWIGLGNSAPYASFKKSGLLAAMENVCRKRPQVRLILCGLEKGLGKELDIHPDQIKIYPLHLFEEWVNILLKLDIGLAPGIGDFDLRLSSIDLLEFMISKIPWVASDQLASHKLLQYGRWVPNSPEAWENAILGIVDQLNVSQKKASREPFLYALSQDVSVNIDKVLKVYTSIISQTYG